MFTKGLEFMKGLSTEQNVHTSMNIVHDLVTLTTVRYHRYMGIKTSPNPTLTIYSAPEQESQLCSF